MNPPPLLHTDYVNKKDHALVVFFLMEIFLDPYLAATADMMMGYTMKNIPEP